MMDRVVFQDRNLSSLGGLLLFKELLAGIRLDERVGEALPRQRIASGALGFDKFRALLLGFLSGAECLEDMDKLRSDPMFLEVNGTLVGSTTYGDYLRKFSGFHLQSISSRHFAPLKKPSKRARNLSNPEAPDAICCGGRASSTHSSSRMPASSSLNKSRPPSDDKFRS
ncbi:MAG TPA: hypothetical protein VFO10_03820 [Oligoflexus sp.]|uniref:hypothetical protein n=1 Tax=Oligoflexus sp. TaxID=1971216 RepID=UPI002D7F4284|nr:hypothetical protein [Oligoflexus sp.]HET9236346.1 hypothetical protein [Oligoflexus sp.]